MPAAPVLDSFALLAFLRGEAGDENVAALLEKAGKSDTPLHMTQVNYAEVKYMVIRKDGAERWAEVEGGTRYRRPGVQVGGEGNQDSMDFVARPDIKRSPV